MELMLVKILWKWWVFVSLTIPVHGLKYLKFYISVKFEDHFESN